MGLTYGFYNAVDHDRVYDAKQLSRIFDGIIRDGVFGGIGQALAVRADTGLSVLVGDGRAWFDRTWTNNDSDMSLTLDTADLLFSRIDSIILEVDESDAVRANSIKVVKGTAASTPVAPTLTNTAYVHQYPLAQITLPAGTTTILTSMIENKIGSSDCPIASVIGPVVNLDVLLNQWDNAFTTWLANIQAQLTPLAVGNLQNQVDAINLNHDKLGWIPYSGTYPIPHSTHTTIGGYHAMIGLPGNFVDVITPGVRVRYKQTVVYNYYKGIIKNSFGNASITTLDEDTSFPADRSMTNNAVTQVANVRNNRPGAFFNGTSARLQLNQTGMVVATANAIFSVRIKTTVPSRTLFYADASLPGAFEVSIDATGAILVALAGTNNPTITSSKIVTDDVFHRVTVTVHRSHYQLYIDGKLDGECWMISSDAGMACQVYHIGVKYVGTTYSKYFSGTMQDFFLNLYDTLAEKQEYNANLEIADDDPFKYGIVVGKPVYSGGHTYFDVYTGTDYNIYPECPLTEFSWSNCKFPSGFPAKEQKWRLLRNLTSRSKASGAAGTTYILQDNIQLSLGYWKVKMFGDLKITAAASASLILCSLVPVSTIDTNSLVFKTNTLATSQLITAYDEGYVEVTGVPLINYKLQVYGSLSSTYLGFVNGLTISAVCAYL